MRSRLRDALTAAERLLLPVECLVCRRTIPEHEPDEPVCRGCLLRMRPVAPPWCVRCGQPRPLFGPCRLCAGWPEELRQCRSAVWLDEGARAAVHTFKYQGATRMARVLAGRIAELLRPPAPEAVLVPVPLAPARLKDRGFNQSAVLAEAMSRLWGLPVQDHWLARKRETATQTALTPEARRANVAGAFQLRVDECGLRIEERSIESAIRNPQSAIVLVDDVFTTGATLAECARALAAGGARHISAVTFGRAAIPDFT